MKTNFTPVWAAEPNYEQFIQKCKANGVSRIITTIPPKELADIANKNNVDVIAYSALNVSGDMRKSYTWSLQYMNGDPNTEDGRKILDGHRPIWSNMETELTFSGDRDDFAKDNPQLWTKSHKLISELDPGKRIQLSPGFKEVRSYEANRFLKAYKSSQSQGVQLEFVLPNIDQDGNADLGYETVSTNPCGEIPLCPYDSCRLLAINLFSYVEEPFTEQASFNFELFRKHVGKAQRIMDDIIDLELEKIDAILAKIDADPENEEIKGVEKNLWLNIRKKAHEGRRTGIGITAEGDMLAALNIRYGSKEGIDFSVDVHKNIALAAYRASVDTAKERGAFSIYDSDREKDNPLINRLKQEDEKLYYDMIEHGRRNIALLTIAPTGTTSLMTQTTSGIEPVFLPVYKRRRKVNPGDKDARVDFVDEVGDSWEEYVVFHHRFKQWMRTQGHDTEKNYSQEELDKLVKLSPYYQATSNDVDWLSKVKMQGGVQKWIDHSISVTINLPSDVSEDLVGKLYLEAWEAGCKGVTVYRDGSRSGVLISNDDKKKEEKKEQAGGAFPLKRPQTLEADVVRFQNAKDKWIAFIGLVDGKPYEIFTGFADDEEGILIPRWVNDGLIIKNRDEDGVSRYDFQYQNKRGYKTTIEGLSHKFNPEYWNYAKLISSTLRHGMSIDKVVDLINSLQLDSESINTWKNGVARALKRYIADGTVASKEKCNNCNSSNLIYQEGCLTCKDCGSSKCG